MATITTPGYAHIQRQHGRCSTTAGRRGASNSVRFSARAVSSVPHAAAASSAPAFLPVPFVPGADAPSPSGKSAIGVPKAPRKGEEGKRLNFFQRAAAMALDAFEEGFVANVLERPHGLPSTADPCGADRRQLRAGR
ncbi:hypothetical protein EE612_019235 [Oryza sativa]|nr:hypothetical protein EE612_019235 [Oryza sativa]